MDVTESDLNPKDEKNLYKFWFICYKQWGGVIKMSDYKMFFVLLLISVALAFYLAKDEENLWEKTKQILLTAVIGALVSLALNYIIIHPGQWGPWSEWSNVFIEENDTREVEKREVTIGYIMTVYVTQEEASPHYRNFRDFSINGDYDRYGARSSYGEKHFDIQVSPEQLASATTYNSGEFVLNNDAPYVGGYNKSKGTAYVMKIALDDQGRYYPLFIKEEIKETQYRYREKIIK